jgi:hypothetical protein
MSVIAHTHTRTHAHAHTHTHTHSWSGARAAERTAVSSGVGGVVEQRAQRERAGTRDVIVCVRVRVVSF